MPETSERRLQIIDIQRYKKDLKNPNYFYNFFIEIEAFKVDLMGRKKGAFEGAGMRIFRNHSDSQSTGITECYIYKV